MTVAVSGRSQHSIDWVCDQVTPTTSCVFRALSADPSIDLTVHYIHEAISSHPWQTRLAEGYPSRGYRRRVGLDWTLLRFAASDRSSVLVTGSWNEPTIQLALTTLAARRRPFVVWTDTPALLKRRNSAKAYLRSRWLNFIFSRAVAVMGTGKPALAALTLMGCPTTKLVNFPYFVDVSTYSFRERPALSRPLIFLSSGRLHAQKGYDIALRGLALALADSDRPFTYKIAGAGPERNRLEQLASELNIREHVEFLGWLEPSELAALYAETDIYLHPARFEPYGVSVLEAMASGVVVLASDSTMAAVDRVISGMNGVIHRSDDPEDLACQIRMLIEDPQRMQEMRKAARATAEQWPLTRAVEIVRRLLASCG